MLAFQGFVRRLIAHGIRVFSSPATMTSGAPPCPPPSRSSVRPDASSRCKPSIYPVDDIVIAALPWTHPGNVVAAMDGVDRDSVNDAAARGLAEGAMVMSVRCETEFPHLTPLLVGHWAISGAALPTGLDTAMLREPVIPLEALQETGFALAAFGHIHKAQVVASDPVPTIYAGSPQVNSWGEADGEHGIWVWDSAPPGALKFHAIEDRPFVDVDLDVGKWFPRAPMADSQGAVVRVQVHRDGGGGAEDRPGYIRRALLDARGGEGRHAPDGRARGARPRRGDGA